MIAPIASSFITPANVQPKTVPTMTGTELSKQFGDFLNNAITQLSASQAQAESLNQQFVKGEITDVHQVMIASEEATLGLQLTVQIRNKMIEAYQDIMRMQL